MAAALGSTWPTRVLVEEEDTRAEEPPAAKRGTAEEEGTAPEEGTAVEEGTAEGTVAGTNRVRSSRHSITWNILLT